MISPELVKILVCPETRLPLTLAEPSLVATINGAVATGALLNRAGQPITAQLSAALVRSDRAIAYPVIDDIPMLLVDESIELAQLTSK
jgi:uncharacterized protein YbaR (Trm112 family)